MNEFARCIHQLPRRVNDDPTLRRLGRYCSAEFMLAADAAECHLHVTKGHLDEVVDGPFRMRSWQFAIRAPLSAWQEFWMPQPAVGFNDIFAMTRYGHARIDGDIAPLLANLRYIKEVLALPRQVDAGTTK